MSLKSTTRLLHQGEYAAGVEVHLIESENGWSPCLSIADAQKLDHVRQALEKGDLKAAAQFGRVYRLTPMAV